MQGRLGAPRDRQPRLQGGQGAVPLRQHRGGGLRSVAGQVGLHLRQCDRDGLGGEGGGVQQGDVGGDHDGREGGQGGARGGGEEGRGGEAGGRGGEEGRGRGRAGGGGGRGRGGRAGRGLGEGRVVRPLHLARSHAVPAE